MGAQPEALLLGVTAATGEGDNSLHHALRCILWLSLKLYVCILITVVVTLSLACAIALMSLMTCLLHQQCAATQPAGEHSSLES